MVSVTVYFKVNQWKPYVCVKCIINSLLFQSQLIQSQNTIDCLLIETDLQETWTQSAVCVFNYCNCVQKHEANNFRSTIVFVSFEFNITVFWNLRVEIFAVFCSPFWRTIIRKLQKIFRNCCWKQHPFFYITPLIFIIF